MDALASIFKAASEVETLSTPSASNLQPRSAGVVVVRSEAGAWRCLMLRAYRDWDFPKGEIACDESPLAAAVREAEEESSLTGLSFDWGEIYCDTTPYSRGKIARYFIAQVADATVKLGINPALGRAEHHEFRWMTVDEARALAATRLRPIIDWATALLARSPVDKG